MTKPQTTALAQLLDRFGLQGSQVQPIQMEAGKAVWRIETARGPVCLKELHHNVDRSLFALEAQRHIAANGGPVAAVLLTRDGKITAEHEGRLFAAYYWLQGRRPQFGRAEDARAMVQALARFHLASRGFKPPEGSRVSTKWGRWPDHYATMCRQMAECAEWAIRRLGAQTGKALTPLFAEFIQEGTAALEALQRSPYPRMIREQEPRAPLCHQDYGEGNAIITGRGAYVLDLDGVTFDLVARDLRKLAYKIARMRRWDPGAVADLIGWYESAVPLADDEKAAFLADLRFPHDFHASVKDLRKESVSPREIMLAAQRERDKKQALAVLETAWGRR